MLLLTPFLQEREGREEEEKGEGGRRGAREGDGEGVVNRKNLAAIVMSHSES